MNRYRKGAPAPPWGTPLPGSRKGVRPAPVRTVYLRVRVYLEVKLQKERPRRFHTASQRSHGVFRKAPLTSREAMMRSTTCTSVTVSWKKMAPCGEHPGIAPQRLAGMWGSRWGRMRRRMMVQTMLTSVTPHTMGRQLSRLARSPFL